MRVCVREREDGREGGREGGREREREREGESDLPGEMEVKSREHTQKV